MTQARKCSLAAVTACTKALRPQIVVGASRRQREDEPGQEGPSVSCSRAQQSQLDLGSSPGSAVVAKSASLRQASVASSVKWE